MPAESPLSARSEPFETADPAEAEPGSGPAGAAHTAAADGEGERKPVDREKVEKVITVIRPAIQADGGDVKLVDIDVETGVVTVELLGACVSCPISTVTLKAGIERILKDRVEGVTEVVNAGEAEFEGTPLSL